LAKLSSETKFTVEHLLYLMTTKNSNPNAILIAFRLQPVGYEESMWDQLPIISLNATEFVSVIRFSVENLLNSGCHIADNLTALKKYFFC